MKYCFVFGGRTCDWTVWSNLTPGEETAWLLHQTHFTCLAQESPAVTPLQAHRNFNSGLLVILFKNWSYGSASLTFDPSLSGLLMSESKPILFSSIFVTLSTREMCYMCMCKFKKNIASCSLVKWLERMFMHWRDVIGYISVAALWMFLCLNLYFTIIW